MKRKTNLFYTTGPDSKFLTFSNYTECMTGNYLSLETKLFPDKFLCLKIKNLNSITKADFIKYIAAYYENKLAVLRDFNIKNSNNVEVNIFPLAYLLEAILYVCKFENNEWELDINKLNDFKTNNIIFSDERNLINKYSGVSSLDNLITYVGEITEQDYNGIYSDTICTVDLNLYNEGSIILKNQAEYNNENKLSAINIIDNGYSLYGWENDNLIVSDYNNVQSLYDIVLDADSENVIKGVYYNNTMLSELKLFEIVKGDTLNYNKTLSFNIIIPLFNLLNKNINHDSWSLYNINGESYYKYIDLDKDNSHVYDVPYGIWINADEEEDTFIELKKDLNLNMYPSWSLLISSQFKPFPYSNNLVEENYSKDSILHAHATYAEILSKFNNLIDVFSLLNNAINSLDNRVQALENTLENIGVIDANNQISKYEKKLIDTELRVANEISDLKEKIYGYIENIRWSDNIMSK